MQKVSTSNAKGNKVHTWANEGKLDLLFINKGERGDVVGWVTALQTGQVVGSIPYGVIGIFYWHNPSGRTMALGLIQPVSACNRNEYQKYFLGVKVAGT